MRPGEVVIMRLCDIDRSGSDWNYRPHSHKTDHHGHERVIPIGPRAQEVLTPWLKAGLPAFLFSPRESMARTLAERRRNRKTPRWPSHKAAQARKRKKALAKAPGVRYHVGSYLQAIIRARDAAFLHPTLAGIPKKKLTADQRSELSAWRKRHHWHPHQLRRSAATAIRRKFGL
jgi:hypothetical protein